MPLSPEITIPAFDANASLVAGRNSTIIELTGEGDTLEIRNVGTAGDATAALFIHSTYPANANALKGFPLMPAVTGESNLRGEARLLSGPGAGCRATYYLTSEGGTTIRVLAATRTHP